MLAHHLAYSDLILTLERAEWFTAAIVTFAADGARWWTNSEIAQHDDGLRRGLSITWGWQPLTAATFGAGVIGVDSEHVLLAWALDED